jgi:hypothetical protein
MLCDNDDLTRRRVVSKWKAFMLEFEPIYQRSTTPKDGFWSAWDRECPKLEARLVERPLSTIDIETAILQFRSKMLKAL